MLAEHSRYQVLEMLGAGGMGAVYKAEHRLMKRLVALKVINPSLVDRPELVERFRREVQAAARLAHPNIATAHDAEHAGALHFLVMEFIAGRDLARVVEEEGPLSIARACDYTRQAALGLQHAHERGMVHRDIKPHNLMLTTDGQVKILDFGLAHFASENAADALTAVGSVMGTPDYIAPEQARDAHQADIRADIYSLGCSLYFLLTGQPPFPGGTFMSKLSGHLERTPQSVAKLRKDVPADLLGVLNRMMCKDRCSAIRPQPRSPRHSRPSQAPNRLPRFAASPRSLEPASIAALASRSRRFGAVGSHWVATPRPPPSCSAAIKASASPLATRAKLAS